MYSFWGGSGGDSPVSELYVPTLRNVGHIKVRRQGITKKKEQNMQNTANVWNQRADVLRKKCIFNQET
jgi:Holliday junction resolvase-like predicted endonuclease